MAVNTIGSSKSQTKLNQSICRLLASWCRAVFEKIFFLQTPTVNSCVNFAQFMSQIESYFRNFFFSKILFFKIVFELFVILNNNNNIPAIKSQGTTLIKQKVVIF